MNYVVAVSGGVDSIVLLAKLVQDRTRHVIVAHFDHGIRADSRADARFVAELARLYGLECETERAELGREASEHAARTARYAFLKRVASKHQAQLVTAHHQDDIIETIAINLQRGTGWRGLSVFGDESISRPLLSYTKSDLYDYALCRRLEWVEDETNNSDHYLRNRIRKKTALLSREKKTALLALYDHQTTLKARIQDIVPLVKTHSRYYFIMIDEIIGLELLRAMTNTLLTRPQLSRLLLAVKTYRAGTVLKPGGGVTVRFTKKEFFLDVNRVNCYNKATVID